MSEEHQAPGRIAELLVHIGRAARTEDGRSELTAAQWACLRFLARANGSTRTPSGFASFQATTRGTASQIIKSLETRGLVIRAQAKRDRRSVALDLTETGRAMLARDPLRDTIDVVAGLGPGAREKFLETLSHLASALAARRNAPAFGCCRDCGHYGTSGSAGYCACMAAELAADETGKLCASYMPRPGPLNEGERHGTD